MHKDQNFSIKPTPDEKVQKKVGANEPSILIEAKQEPHIRADPPKLSKRTQTVSALELVLQDLIPVEFIVDKIVPVGLTFLAGAPKAGKSILTIMISLAVGNGRQVFNGLGTNKSEVLLVSLEDGYRTIQNRMVGMANKFPPCQAVHIATKWGKSFDENLDKLEKYLMKNDKVRLVIIDTFALFCGSSKKGTYASEYKIAHDLKKLADLYDTSIFAIQHVLKTIRGDWISCIYGTHGFVAAADSVLYLERSRGAKQAKLNVTGRNIEDESINLKFESENLIWIIDDNVPDIELQPERRQILDLLTSANRPMRLSDIANHVGKTTTNTQNLLKKLIELNLVDRIGQGVYGVVTASSAKSKTTAAPLSPGQKQKPVDSMDSMDFRYLWS